MLVDVGVCIGCVGVGVCMCIVRNRTWVDCFCAVWSQELCLERWIKGQPRAQRFVGIELNETFTNTKGKRSNICHYRERSFL